MKKIGILIIIVAFIFISCTGSTEELNKAQSEVKRLAVENYELRKELIEVTERSSKLENTVENLTINLEIAQKNQEERYVEFYEMKTEMIEHLANIHRTDDLIDFTMFKEAPYDYDVYGKALNDEIDHIGINAFVEILANKDLSVVDEVTELIVMYAIKNDFKDSLLTEIDGLPYTSDDKKLYMVNRVKYWLMNKVK